MKALIFACALLIPAVSLADELPNCDHYKHHWSKGYIGCTWRRAGVEVSTEFRDRYLRRATEAKDPKEKAWDEREAARMQAEIDYNMSIYDAKHKAK